MAFPWLVAALRRPSRLYMAGVPGLALQAGWGHRSDEVV